jgi:uncharacterized protein (DUF302 family)
MEHVSDFPFEATVSRVIAAIETAGLTVIDHTAAAKAVGLEMLSAVVLIYGSARAGTSVLRIAPNTALDLPLRVLVRESADGDAVLVFHAIGAILRNAGALDNLARHLEPAQRLLIDAIHA